MGVRLRRVEPLESKDLVGVRVFRPGESGEKRQTVLDSSRDFRTLKGLYILFLKKTSSGRNGVTVPGMDKRTEVCTRTGQRDETHTQRNNIEVCIVDDKVK